MSKLVLVSALFLVVGCSSKPKATPEAAGKACVRHVELGFWKGFEASVVEGGATFDDAARAEGEKGLAEVLASPEGQAQVAKCTQSYVELATLAQVECITAAKTSDDAAACVK